VEAKGEGFNLNPAWARRVPPCREHPTKDTIYVCVSIILCTCIDIYRYIFGPVMGHGSEGEGRGTQECRAAKSTQQEVRNIYTCI